MPATRRATSLASTALKIRLKPQLNHEVAIAKNATSATAPRGVRGQPAMARIALPIGAEVASTWPVMMISDICSVNGIRSQKPPPHASTTCVNDDGVATSAAANTMMVASNAKMKASGIHFSVHAVRRIAARATKPVCSSIVRDSIAVLAPRLWPAL